MFRTPRWVKQYARTASVIVRPIRQGDPHRLPSSLIVSLTSYPARFPTLHLTLRTLLSQDVRPDRLILWIASADRCLLPKRVVDLQSHGLEIAECEDLKSYKKIIPTLLLAPDAFILTADDDVYYPRNWLRGFVEAYRNPREVICQRARRITWLDDRIAPYGRWPVIQGEECGPQVLPTGVGGVLYPPGSLPLEAGDASRFMQLCPTADDLWLYFMTSRNGCSHRTIKPAGTFTAWRGSQRVALWRVNKTLGENDGQLRSMLALFPMQPVHEQASVD